MLKNFFSLKITTLFIALSFLSVSCQKEDPEPEPQPNNPGTTNPPYFKWQIDNGAVVTADSAYAYVQSFVLFAIKNTGQNVEVNLSSMNTGTYNISTATGNQLKYSDSSNEHETSGTFVISSSTSSKMTGYFNCTFTGSSLSTITGTFSDVPKR